VEAMAAAGVDVAIECGAGSALVGMLKSIAPEIRALPATDVASVEAAAELLASAAPVRASA